MAKNLWAGPSARVIELAQKRVKEEDDRFEKTVKKMMERLRQKKKESNNDQT